MKVLIAEDDPISLLLLRRAVERRDWMMPGIDGPGLVRRIRDGNGTATSSCSPRSPTTIAP